MKAGRRIEYEDDLVVVTSGKTVIYSGLEDYEPMRNANWKFVKTTKDGKGHYEFDKYKKYCLDVE